MNTTPQWKKTISDIIDAHGGFIAYDEIVGPIEEALQQERTKWIKMIEDSIPDTDENIEKSIELLGEVRNAYSIAAEIMTKRELIKLLDQPKKE